jgi:predicted DNA-binding transcriptional regulator YafY
VECRLADDQKIKPYDDDCIIIEATVPDTYDLRWWLMGFGDQVEVLAPKSLRDEFREISAGMLADYK